MGLNGYFMIHFGPRIVKNVAFAIGTIMFVRACILFDVRGSGVLYMLFKESTDAYLGS